MAYALTTIVIIELGLYLFGSPDYSKTSLFALMLDPPLVTTSAFALLFATSTFLFLASAIIPGQYVTLNIYGVYAAIVSQIITYISVISQLIGFVNGQLRGLFLTCVNAGTGVCPAPLITMIFTAPLIIFFIITTVDWIRSNL